MSNNGSCSLASIDVTKVCGNYRKVLQTFLTTAFKCFHGAHHCVGHRAGALSNQPRKGALSSGTGRAWSAPSTSEPWFSARAVTLWGLHWSVDVTLGASQGTLGEPALELVPFASQTPTEYSQEVCPQAFTFPSEKNFYALLFLVKLQSFSLFWIPLFPPILILLTLVSLSSCLCYALSHHQDFVQFSLPGTLEYLSAPKSAPRKTMTSK